MHAFLVRTPNCQCIFPYAQVTPIYHPTPRDPSALKTLRRLKPVFFATPIDSFVRLLLRGPLVQRTELQSRRLFAEPRLKSLVSRPHTKLQILNFQKLHVKVRKMQCCPNVAHTPQKQGVTNVHISNVHFVLRGFSALLDPSWGS